MFPKLRTLLLLHEEQVTDAWVAISWMEEMGMVSVRLGVSMAKFQMDFFDALRL